MKPLPLSVPATTPGKMTTPSPASSRRSPKDGREAERRYAARLVPLFLMTVCSVVFVLHLASSSVFDTPADRARSSAGGRGLASFSTGGDVSPSLKTHLPSNGGAALHAAREEAALNGDHGVLYCDRSQYRTDQCFARGDIRADPATNTFFLHRAPPGTPPEKIKPYPRKFEASVMATIDEVTIAAAGQEQEDELRCDVRHRTRAVVMSTGGYSGNVYHDFNDGLIPLYITARKYAGEVVLVVLEYHHWWMHRYGPVVEQLAGGGVVELGRDRVVHCFPEIIVGLEFHDELSVDPKRMLNGESMADFQQLLRRAYDKTVAPSPLPLPSATTPPPSPLSRRGKLRMVIFNRITNRALVNLRDVVTACRHAGFGVRVLNVKTTTSLAAIHGVLYAADAMLAVHGAAATHFLFMRPATAFLQVVPLGLDWAAESYYGGPARRLGLEYYEYKVSAEESSLAAEFGADSTVVRDPGVIGQRGWWEMKKTYLDRQNVTLDVRRLAGVLQSVKARRRGHCKRGKATSDVQQL